jgi:putative DNA primase/helicase
LSATLVDIRCALLDAMHSCGVNPGDPSTIIPNGRLHRFHVDGERIGRQSGWLVAHADGRPSAAFGDWRTGASHRWRYDNGTSETPADRERFRSMIETARAARDADLAQRHAVAAARAGTQWAIAVDADLRHEYLARKRVKPHGIKQQGIALLIPMRDANGALHSIETILPDGTKRFFSGGRKRGCMHLIGGPIVDRVALCEGYATGASIYEATGVTTAVAFDAGNLPAVAIALRAKYPRADLIVMADRDEAGIKFGREAAAAVGGRLAIAPELHCGN